VRNLYYLLFTYLIVSCSTYPHHEGRSDYLKTLEASSAGDKQFSGLYDNFEFRATLLRRPVAETLHRRLTQIYAWDQETAEQKRAESEQEMTDKSLVWLSFFTPSGKDDNLDKKNAIWKTYLVVDGQRYEGIAKKSKQSLSEAQELFPYHTRWATAYTLEFPIPTERLTGRRVELVITGPLGRRQVIFP
jgi:hypothetical protein